MPAAAVLLRLPYASESPGGLVIRAHSDSVDPDGRQGSACVRSSQARMLHSQDHTVRVQAL